MERPEEKEEREIRNASRPGGALTREVLRGAGLLCALFAVSAFVPIIGFFFALMMPLPCFLYRLKLGRAGGGYVVGLAGGIIAAVMGGLSFDALFIIELMLMGYGLGECVARRFPVEKAVLLTSLGVLGIAAVALWFYGAIQGMGIVETVSRYVEQNLQLTLKLYEAMGVSGEVVQAIADSIERIRHLFVRILPGMVTAFALFIAWVTLIGGRSLMVRIGVRPPDFGNLSLWQPPDMLIWPLILSVGSLLVADSWVRIIAINLLIPLLVVYFFAGIAIVSFFMEKKRFSRGIRLLVYGLIAFQQVALFLVICLGVFDLWLNFRKRGSRTPKNDI